MKMKHKVGIGEKLQSLKDARAELERGYHAFDLEDAGIDVEELLKSFTLREVLAEVKARDVELTVESCEIERLVVEQDYAELAFIADSGSSLVGGSKVNTLIERCRNLIILACFACGSLQEELHA